jgi:hypothetical protein
MGVDAGIFAKKSKKYFWFDRLSNIEVHWSVSDSHLFDWLQETRQNIMDQKNPLPAEKVSPFLHELVTIWELAEEDQRYHGGWVSDCIKFVEAHPDDLFFVASDNGNAYDLIGEMHGIKGGIWKGLYMEWKPECAFTRPWILGASNLGDIDGHEAVT